MDTTAAHPARDGRALALLTACHLDGRDSADLASAWELLWERPVAHEGSELPQLLANKQARAFATKLLQVLVEQRAEIDAAIERVSKRWRLARMDVVDRNVIRLAAAEHRAGRATPEGVLLSETVELASRYGSERSARFVNGIVGGLLREGGHE